MAKHRKKVTTKHMLNPGCFSCRVLFSGLGGASTLVRYFSLPASEDWYSLVVTIVRDFPSPLLSDWLFAQLTSVISGFKTGTLTKAEGCPVLFFLGVLILASLRFSVDECVWYEFCIISLLFVCDDFWKRNRLAGEKCQYYLGCNQPP